MILESVDGAIIDLAKGDPNKYLLSTFQADLR